MNFRIPRRVRGHLRTSPAQIGPLDPVSHPPERISGHPDTPAAVSAVVSRRLTVGDGLKAASAWQAQEARYASEALGLTPRSLASLGWKIVE